jgi:hypothetical protein
MSKVPWNRRAVHQLVSYLLSSLELVSVSRLASLARINRAPAHGPRLSGKIHLLLPSLVLGTVAGVDSLPTTPVASEDVHGATLAD